MFVIIFSGAPASGKDTQGELIFKWLKRKYPSLKIAKIISSEELLKFFKKGPKRIKFFNKVYLKEKEKSKFYSGKLVSFGFISGIICEKIKKYAKKKYSLVIIGSPRSKFEAKKMLSVLRDFYFDNFILIYLKVKIKTIYSRALKRKRKEGLDVKEKIKVRIKEFKKNVIPAILIFKEEKKLWEVDGEPSIEKIHREIRENIGSYIKI